MRPSKRFINMLALFAAFFTFGVLTNEVPAGSFNITPVRISLDSRSKAERIAIRNNGVEEIRLQMDVYVWSQTDDGKDAYEATSDIVVYPKMLSIPKDEERIVRVGLKKALSVSRERTYRLYIQELPGVRDAQKGVAVTMLMKAGVPIFLAPTRPEVRGSLDSIRLAKGTVELKIRNSGTRHFIPSSIVVKGLSDSGKELFSKEVVGWYLLSGATRVYSVVLQKDQCKNAARLDIAVTADMLTLKGTLDVEKDACSP